MKPLGFGGSCHWCTEAIFQSLKGVEKVEQGWILSDKPHDTFSEGVIFHYDENQIDLQSLISIHLYTHSCTSVHSMRNKYRSAIYYYISEQKFAADQIIAELQSEFKDTIITKALPFRKFKLNKEDYLNYYYKNPEKPFCKNYINPKLNLLRQRFSKSVKIRE